MTEFQTAIERSASSAAAPQGTATNLYLKEFLGEYTTTNILVFLGFFPSMLNAVGNVLSGLNGTTVLLRTSNGTLGTLRNTACSSAPKDGVRIHPAAERILKSAVFTYSMRYKVKLTKAGSTVREPLTEKQKELLISLQGEAGREMMIDVTYAFRIDVTRAIGSDGRYHITTLLAYPVKTFLIRCVKKNAR